MLKGFTTRIIFEYLDNYNFADPYLYAKMISPPLDEGTRFTGLQACSGTQIGPLL
jgi:hypothetical protein